RQIVDSHFVALMADPVASLRNTYEQLELDWPAGHDRVITDYLANKPKGKHGTHSYTLADVGLDEASVRATFKHYVAHYKITEECLQVVDVDDLCLWRFDRALGQEEAPKHHAERAAFGV